MASKCGGGEFDEVIGLDVAVCDPIDHHLVEISDPTVHGGAKGRGDRLGDPQRQQNPFGTQPSQPLDRRVMFGVGTERAA